MEPAGAASPWPVSSDFHEGQIVYDLVYAPAHNDDQTRLLRDAAAQGSVTIGGMAMLVAQAAASFKLWTGREMPMDAVLKALSTTF
jgi:shikimate dehydrogenase